MFCPSLSQTTIQTLRAKWGFSLCYNARTMSTRKQKRLLTLFCTRPIWGLIPVRIAFGTIIALHGAKRLIEARQSTGAFIELIPSEAAFIIILLFAIVEFIAALMIIPGFLTRVAGFLLVVELAVSIIVERLPLGFGNLQFELLLFVVANMLFMSGAGRYSVDRGIARKLLKKYPSQKHEAYTIAETPYCKWYE